MIRTIFAFCLAASTTACAVPAKQVSGPDGHPAYSLTCSGMMRTKEDCYQKAGEICPNGYRVNDESIPMRAADASYLLISCKTADNAIPHWPAPSPN